MTPESVRSLFREVDPAQLLRRICVRPPYFALRGLRYTDGYLEANASAELLANREVGPIQGAELSRHAAIAGLCVAALGHDDPDRRYYLAKQAWYEGAESSAPHGAPIELRARLLRLTKREARAAIVATAGGAEIASLEVRYAVLSAPAFERLFRARRQPTPERFSMGRLPPGRVTRAGDSLHRTVGPIPVEACAGHFDDYPAMPVAVLMGELVSLAVEALGEGVARYRIVRGRVEARDFCWAGEVVELAVTPARERASGSGDGEVTLACAARAAGRLAATMDVTLMRLPA